MAHFQSFSRGRLSRGLTVCVCLCECVTIDLWEVQSLQSAQEFVFAELLFAQNERRKSPLRCEQIPIMVSRSRSIIGTWTFLGCERVMNWWWWINIVRTLLVETYNYFRIFFFFEFVKKNQLNFSGFHRVHRNSQKTSQHNPHNPTVTLVTVPLNKRADKSNPICYRTSQRTLRTKCIHLRGPPNVSFLTVSFPFEGSTGILMLQTPWETNMRTVP